MNVTFGELMVDSCHVMIDADGIRVGILPDHHGVWITNSHKNERKWGWQQVRVYLQTPQDVYTETPTEVHLAIPDEMFPETSNDVHLVTPQDVYMETPNEVYLEKPSDVDVKVRVSDLCTRDIPQINSKNIVGCEIIEEYQPAEISMDEFTLITE